MSNPMSNGKIPVTPVTCPQCQQRGNIVIAYEETLYKPVLGVAYADHPDTCHTVVDDANTDYGATDNHRLLCRDCGHSWDLPGGNYEYAYGSFLHNYEIVNPDDAVAAEL